MGEAAILALGGGSWGAMGSDGRWVSVCSDLGIDVAPLRPSNCGFDMEWSARFAVEQGGSPIKNVALFFEGESCSGELMVTQHGVEGTPVYALSALLREAICELGAAILRVDLKPDLDEARVRHRLSCRRHKDSLSNYLRKSLKLNKTAVALVMECTQPDDRADPDRLAEKIKRLPLRLTAPRPLAEAISTAGGVRFNQLNEDLMVKAHPGIFIAGEMLDWEAPTGGYLLQGCFSTGFRAADGVKRWLASRHSPMA